jgi:uncharacterized protein (TIGR02246 family)
MTLDIAVTASFLPATSSRPMTSHDVIALYERLLDAWNFRDRHAFANLFTQDGQCIGIDGSPMNGRHEIATELMALFAEQATSSFVAKVRDVRWLHPHVAILVAVAGMVPVGASDLDPALHTTHTVVAVSRSGTPRAALLQNTPASFRGSPHLGERLTRELTGVLDSGVTVAFR